MVEMILFAAALILIGAMSSKLVQHFARPQVKLQPLKLDREQQDKDRLLAQKSRNRSRYPR
ncbi:hypothetical protein [Marinomonas mediterranea]|uniref:hypothetical protein n=1 Tax=Marinomonas mediterranea TaxID=119864 RepID=UPI0023493AA8|nr:hypothetical protein [Marinomonas mediterranea]WCN09679.1 hypothetical protein GV055_12525 [Marinomonas mediterranea]